MSFSPITRSIGIIIVVIVTAAAVVAIDSPVVAVRAKVAIQFGATATRRASEETTATPDSHTHAAVDPDSSTKGVCGTAAGSAAATDHVAPAVASTGPRDSLRCRHAVSSCPTPAVETARSPKPSIPSGTHSEA